MKILPAIFCVAIAAALAAPVGAQKGEPKQAAKKRGEPKAAKKKRVKIEKLACRLGTEDEHARIAVLLADGKVENFAYYSKWKPRTCSMDVKRDDAFSKWVDTGNTTVVTLIEEKGAFLIDHSPGRYHFIFRDIDRMRYCGMEGKVNGSLTIWRGKPQCAVTGVMDREEPPPVTAVGKPADTPAEGEPHVGRAQAIPDLRKAAEELKAGKPAEPAAAGASSAPASPAVAPSPAAAAPTGAPQPPAKSN